MFRSSLSLPERSPPSMKFQTLKMLYLIIQIVKDLNILIILYYEVILTCELLRYMEHTELIFILNY